MVELCLMASQGYPPVPGFVFHPEQGMRRTSQDCLPVLLSPESRQDMIKSCSLSTTPHQSEQSWKPISGLLDFDQFVGIDSTVRRPVLIDVQDTRPNSILFSFGIAEHCTKREEILTFLASGSSEVKRSGLDLSILTDLMGLQAMTTEMTQQPYAPDYGFRFGDAESQPTLFYPSREFHSQKPLLDLVGYLANNSDFMVHLDGQVTFSGSRTEMTDILSIIAEFYLSKNSMKWRKQSMLVPQFNRLEGSETRTNIHTSLKFETINAVPLKSPQKIRLKPSHKKKNNSKAGKERDRYRKNYFHSCESLLSIIVDRKRHGKTAILELKKSGPELTQLLTQFSASIAGTGLAVLFSVVCKVGSGRVPFCASKLLNTGLGFGLVWLSWAVNRLRNTIIHISKNSGKWTMKEDKVMQNLDRSVNEIYFRAATLMAIMVLRLA